MVIRELKMEDVGPLYPLAGSWLREVGHAVNEDKYIKQFKTFLGEDAKSWVAEETDGRLIGWITGYLKEHPWSGKKIFEEGFYYVHLDYRKQGIGKQLLEAGIGWARENGISRVIVMPNTYGSPDPTIAGKAFGASGFTLHGYMYKLELD